MSDNARMEELIQSIHMTPAIDILKFGNTMPGMDDIPDISPEDFEALFDQIDRLTKFMDDMTGRPPWRIE